jgi:hypothetical protein
MKNRSILTETRPSIYLILERQEIRLLSTLTDDVDDNHTPILAT